MHQILFLFWKIEVYNAGCVFAYFCGGCKNYIQLKFCSSFYLEKLLSLITDSFLLCDKSSIVMAKFLTELK